MKDENNKYKFSTVKKFIDPIDLIKELDTDAMKWAEAFMGRIAQGHFTRNDIEADMLVGWFASAIETAKDRVRKELE